MEGLYLCNTTPHLVHLSPAEYSAERFHKIFCHNAACDIIKCMASDLSEYSAAVEQVPRFGGNFASQVRLRDILRLQLRLLAKSSDSCSTSRNWSMAHSTRDLIPPINEHTSLHNSWFSETPQSLYSSMPKGKGEPYPQRWHNSSCPYSQYGTSLISLPASANLSFVNRWALSRLCLQIPIFIITT